MQTTLTVRLSEKETKDLQAICKLSGKTRSEVVREALRTQIFRERLDAIRAIAVPRAREIGWLMEDDVFREVS
ncbi:MAG: ribbon-helix-helix protein, CopG family [Betaproteobacteria bacterium]|nr:ribbon-helix-helix protein, CopG family [Betaproteobacteria bacterium]